MIKTPCYFLISIILLTGCARIGINNTAGGALGGAALGSGIGAIIGSATGKAGVGTAIGAGVGALSGVLVGAAMDASEQERARQNARIDQTDADIAANQRLLEELRARGADASLTDRGVSIHLPDVLFEFNRSDLTPEVTASVREISDVLRNEARGREILVEGHTDSVGSQEYNLSLSTRRADTVARELIHDGVERGRILSKGFGKSKPIASNDSENGRARNRRVEIVIGPR